MKSLGIIGTGLLALIFSLQVFAHGNKAKDLYWIKVEAKDKYERTTLGNMGLPIEAIEEGYVVTLGTQKDLEAIKKKFNVLVAFKNIETQDFPSQDEKFHNYTELTEKLQTLADNNREIMKLYSIGQSLEGRDIWGVTLTANQKRHLDQPAVVFMGGHHAREHISVEMPLMMIENLLSNYRSGDERITRFLNTRSIYIIPVVNPDGKEFDVETGRYKSWRKNRRDNEGSSAWGVDLNRNYDYQWGTVGISKNPSSDVYCGPAPFSEPETRAIRDFVESHENINILTSFHTFSELILYPWGHKHQDIEKEIDFRVHKTMAETMAEWNNYTPQTGSDLYLVSGDTGDWAYGAHGIISFTFELDPKSIWQGGFYPGQDKIDSVFRKNWEPVLYLMEYADNPYRVNQEVHTQYGLNSAIIQ